MNNHTLCGLQKAFLCALLAIIGMAYTACSPIRPLLTHSEAKARRTEEQKALIAKQDALKADLRKPDPISVDTAAARWAKYSREYENRLGQIGRLQQPPNTPLTTSSIIFDPFGAGTSGPRRVQYGRQLLVEAVGINPFKYDVTLDSTPFSYTYEIPDAPTAGAADGGDEKKDKGMKANLPTGTTGLPTFSKIKAGLASYDMLTKQLELLYQRDAWPENQTYTDLVKEAEDLFSPTPVTATNFALYRNEQSVWLAALIATQEEAVAELKKEVDAIKPAKQGGKLTLAQDLDKSSTQARKTAASEELAQLKVALSGVNLKLGGSDASKQSAAFQQAEVLGRVLVALPQGLISRFRVQVPAKGDEMDTKLTLTVRPDYLMPPGRAAGKLLEWETTTQVTHRFRVSASAGAYVTGLQDHTYGLFSDSVQVRRRVDATSTTDTTTRLGFKGARRIGRLNTRENVDIGFTGLTHFHYRLLPAFDVAASVGLGAQTTGVQLLAGFTVLTGGEKQRLCLTGGVIGGRVTRLSGGYREGDKVPAAAFDIVPTQSVNKTSWFFAITYNLTGTREK